jgi:hypothetical protein
MGGALFCSDPESEIPFAKALYSNEALTKSFYNSLSDDGILVMQLGQAVELDDPDDTHSRYKNRFAAVNHLERVGFESIHAYEEVRDQYWMCLSAPLLAFILLTFLPSASVPLWLLDPVDLHCGIQILQHAKTMVR